MKALLLALRSLVLVAGMAVHASAQAGLAPGCRANTLDAPEADAALYLEDWGRAARLYREHLQKDASSMPAQAGLIRVMLGQGHIDDALKQANAMASQHPDSVVIQTVVAETYLRRGELASATPILSGALAQDACYARTHLQEARLQNLSGYHASAARQLEQAHALDPNDEQVTLAWMFSLPPAERFSKLKDFVATAKFLNASDREDLRSNILEGEARMNSPCTVSAPDGGTRVPLVVNPGLSRNPSQPTIDIKIDDKTHRMFLSTYRDSIGLSPQAARSMGLTPIVKFTLAQLYGGGRTHFYLASLASVRIGEVVYRNCLIRVVDELPAVDIGLQDAIGNPAGADGSIGAGFFADFLVDVDTPKRFIQLSPLPPPTPAVDAKGLRTWSDAAASHGAPVPSINGGAWGQYNRVIAPEMKGWSSTVNAQGNMWIPTHIGGGSSVLFLAELADPWPRISTNAAPHAAKIETISTNREMPFKGYFLEFSGRFVPINSWTSERYDEFSKHFRLETAGSIGGEALRQLRMTIDYRDQVIQFAH